MNTYYSNTSNQRRRVYKDVKNRLRHATTGLDTICFAFRHNHNCVLCIGARIIRGCAMYHRRFLASSSAVILTVVRTLYIQRLKKKKYRSRKELFILRLDIVYWDAVGVCFIPLFTHFSTVTVATTTTTTNPYLNPFSYTRTSAPIHSVHIHIYLYFSVTSPYSDTHIHVHAHNSG